MRIMDRLYSYIKSTDGKIIIFSILGFIVTGLLCYPFTVFWDNANVLQHMIDDGHPWITNWMGWYYPCLSWLLYKISGGALVAIGVFQNMLYWIGITLVCLSYLRKIRHRLLWYFIIAWFPGALAFMTGVTNNALLFGYLLVGVGLYTYYRNNYRHRLLLFLSIFFLLQCIFIRKEAIFYIPFIIVAICAIELNEKFKKKTFAVCISFFATVLSICIILSVENAITRRLPDYVYIHPIDNIALFDMNGMSYYKGEMVFPRNIFKKQYQDGKTVMEKVLKDSTGLENDGSCFWGYSDSVMLSTRPYLVSIDNKNSIYLSNIRYYLFFRGKYLEKYLYRYGIYPYDNKGTIVGFPYSGTPLIPAILSKLSIFLGPVWAFCCAAVMLLCMSLTHYINFDSSNKRLLYELCLCLLLATIMLYFVSTVSIQIRYVYPWCLFIFYIAMLTIANNKRSSNF